MYYNPHRRKVFTRHVDTGNYSYTGKRNFRRKTTAVLLDSGSIGTGTTSVSFTTTLNRMLHIDKISDVSIEQCGVYNAATDLKAVKIKINEIESAEQDGSTTILMPATGTNQITDLPKLYINTINPNKFSQFRVTVTNQDGAGAVGGDVAETSRVIIRLLFSEIEEPFEQHTYYPH